ncbi:hypothetical protein AB4144_58735, partial [Rhizobiaceae sp. 2RAB30]
PRWCNGDRRRPARHEPDDAAKGLNEAAREKPCRRLFSSPTLAGRAERLSRSAIPPDFLCRAQ